MNDKEVAKELVAEFRLAMDHPVIGPRVRAAANEFRDKHPEMSDEEAYSRFMMDYLCPREAALRPVERRVQ